MNEFQDGWGDEESLGVDVEDGWGDDELDMLNDEVEVDVDEDGAQAGTSGLIVQQGTETARSCSNSTSTSNSNSAISVDEGWDWDDGDVNASNHGHGHGHGHGREHTIINTDTCSDIDTGVGVGVGNTRKGNDFGTHTNAAGGSGSGSSSRSAVVDPDPDPEPILKIAEQKLLQYITDLGGDPSSSSSLLNSINDELALKHNNKEKALELCRYYHERENLREYTLDAEVPRMDYQIMISDDLILTETQEIQHYFHNHPVDNLVDDMLLRASNQSILADLFPVITGTGADKIIRMQFGANAVANKCRLVLDMRGRRMRTLQVECTLTVSVPAGSSSSMSTSTSTSTGTSSSSSSSSAKLDLAALRFMIHFSPEPSAPFIKYQLVSIQPLLDIHNNGNGNGNGDREKIRAAATLLDPREMEAIQEMTREHEREHNNENDNNNVNVNVRDNFLNSVMATATHQTVTATTAGLKSALQEIDDVVNVKGKFNYLKNAMPVLALPSADEILTAERDFLQEEECPSANSSGSMNGSVSGHFPRPAPPPRPVPVQAPHQHQRHQPPAHSSSLSVSSINAPHRNGNSIGIGNSNGADTGTNVHAATSTSRPKPIIGGMLISGITRLAKAAAITDVNVNVDVNDHAASKSTSMQAQGSMPVLYRKEINVTASNPPPPPAPPHQQQWSDDGVDDAADDDDDGWSDDDLDDGLDDLDDDVDKALAPFLNQTTPTSASTSTSTSAFTKSASTTAITNVGQAPTPAPVNAMRNNNTNSIHVASSAISPSASTSTVNTGTSDTYIKIEHPKMDDHANANAKVSVNVNVNVNVNGPTKDNEYVGISSEYVNVDLNDHGLPVELKAERDYLLQQLTLIENTKNDDCDGLAVASRERECDYDEFTGIVPTRKRFVPRSHILNIVNIGVGGER